VRDESSLAEKVFRPFSEEKFHSFVCGVCGQSVVGADERRLVDDAPATAAGSEAVRQSAAELTRDWDVDAEVGDLADVPVCGGRARRRAAVDAVTAATSHDDRSTGVAERGHQRPARHQRNDHLNRPYFRTRKHFRSLYRLPAAIHPQQRGFSVSMTLGDVTS